MVYLLSDDEASGRRSRGKSSEPGDDTDAINFRFRRSGKDMFDQLLEEEPAGKEKRMSRKKSSLQKIDEGEEVGDDQEDEKGVKRKRSASGEEGATKKTK